MVLTEAVVTVGGGVASGGLARVLADDVLVLLLVVGPPGRPQGRRSAGCRSRRGLKAL